MAEGQSGRGGVAVRLALLGGFAARDGAGRDTAIGSRKAQALLAYLALSLGRPQPRASLRQALSELRRVLPERDPPLPRAQRDSVRLDPDAVEADAATLERRLGTVPAAIRNERSGSP